MRIIVLLLLAAVSLGARADDWITGDTDDGRTLYAGTVNADGMALMQACTVADGMCRWMIVVDIVCKGGDPTPTPIVLNARSEALPAQLYCLGVGGAPKPGEKQFYRHGLSEFTPIDALLRKGGIVGLALPLESGAFRVFRYDLSGAIPKLDKMRNDALSRQKSSTGGVTL